MEKSPIPFSFPIQFPEGPFRGASESRCRPLKLEILMFGVRFTSGTVIAAGPWNHHLGVFCLLLMSEKTKNNLTHKYCVFNDALI